MKHTIILMLMGILLGCTPKKTSNQSVINTHPYLIGKWTGSGHFLDQDFDIEMGKIPFTIHIAEKGIQVKVGSTQIQSPQLSPTNYGFEIRGELMGAINPTQTVEKNKMVILLVLPKTNRKLAQTWESNFHLKENFNFDFTMKVGWAKLSKSPVPYSSTCKEDSVE